MSMKTINYISSVIIFTITVISVQAQTTISGIIKDSTNKPMPDISVILMNVKDSTIIAYTFSNNEGKYKITTKNKSQNLLISIFAFDIQKQTKKIGNRNQTINFIAIRENIAIREVIAKAKKIWGNDTINYLVSAFTDKNDVVIGDVLKKMPGIEVAESGQIKYKGLPINKFYIEKMDMLQGRYGIATNNISAKDISTVQILENHQPIKTLEKLEYSDKAAINLKIKKGAKGIFSIMADLGIGYDDHMLYKSELTGMRFSKKNQKIYTYKTNNSGKDISKELTSFYSNYNVGNKQVTYISTPAPPNIRFERFNFNKSHALTFNNLNKLKNESEINYNIIYYNDNYKSSGLSRTSYLLPDEGTKIISEKMESELNTNRLDGEFRYNANKDKYYFNNYLRFSGKWYNGDSNVNSQKDITQQSDNNILNISNIIHWVKRNENNKGFKFSSTNVIQTQPQQLSITPGLFTKLLNNDNEYKELKQKGNFQEFSSSNNFSLLSIFSSGNFRIEPKVSMAFSYQLFDSYMVKVDNSNISMEIKNKNMRNDISSTKFNLGSAIKLIYNTENIKINLNIPLNYNIEKINNKIKDKNYDENRLFFQPSFYISYSINNNFEVKGSYYFGVNTPELLSLYDGFVLQTYRNMNRYDCKKLTTNRNGGNVSLSYKDVLNMLFIGSNMSFNKYTKQGLYNQFFDENMLSVTKMIEKHNEGESLSFNIRVSKGFYWKGLNISFKTAWGKGENEQLRQNKLINYKNNWVNINGDINLKLFEWWIFGSKNKWGKYSASTNKGDNFSPIESMNNMITNNFYLPWGIGIKTAFENYYNSEVNGNKNFNLVDIGIKYTWRKAKISLDWNNIFNTKKYLNSYYGDLNTYYSEFNIRPTSVMLSVRFKLL